MLPTFMPHLLIQPPAPTNLPFSSGVGTGEEKKGKGWRSLDCSSSSSLLPFTVPWAQHHGSTPTPQPDRLKGAPFHHQPRPIFLLPFFLFSQPPQTPPSSPPRHSLPGEAVVGRLRRKPPPLSTAGAHISANIKRIIIHPRMERAKAGWMERPSSSFMSDG